MIKRGKPIIEIPRASEELTLALVEMGILEIIEDGIKCVEKEK